VQYRDDTHQVWCACHNGIYDLGGRNVSGPPPRPLETYDVHVRGDEIIVERRRSARQQAPTGISKPGKAEHSG
jgi:Rieske Fe-S protein